MTLFVLAVIIGKPVGGGQTKFCRCSKQNCCKKSKMQLAASGHVTGLMYNEISFRSGVQARPGLPRRALSLARVGWGLCIGSGPDEGAPSADASWAAHGREPA